MYFYIKKLFSFTSIYILEENTWFSYILEEKGWIIFLTISYNYMYIMKDFFYILKTRKLTIALIESSSAQSIISIPTKKNDPTKLIKDFQYI